MVDVVGGPAAWRGPELATRTDWVVELSDAQRSELRSALAGVEGRPLRTITAADFELPTLSAVFAGVNDELVDGRGFVLVRGVPLDGLTPDQIEAMYWGIGIHVGRPLHQRSEDDLLVYVRDQGVDPDSPLARGYQTSARLDYHCDSSDVVALLCLRPAASGGASTIVSSVAVHDDLVRRSPELAALLHEQWWHDRKCSRRTGVGCSGTTDARIWNRRRAIPISHRCRPIGWPRSMQSTR
jgi:hypothetical protein